MFLKDPVVARRPEEVWPCESSLDLLPEVAHAHRRLMSFWWDQNSNWDVSFLPTAYPHPSGTTQYGEKALPVSDKHNQQFSHFHLYLPFGCRPRCLPSVGHGDVLHRGAHCRAELQAAAHPIHTVCGLAAIPTYARGALELHVWLCQMKGLGDVTEGFVESLPTLHLEPETKDLVLDFICEIWDLKRDAYRCAARRNHLYQVLNHSKEVEKFSWTEESCLSHTCFDQTEP